MRKSFSDIDTKVVDVPASEIAATAAPEAADPTLAPAVTESKSAKPGNEEMVPDSYFSNEGMTGEYSKHDVRIPWLNLIHPIGDLNAEQGFTPGNFVYDGQLDLGPGPIELTVLRTKKFFQEKVAWGAKDDQGEPIKPEIFATEADVRKAGYFMAWEVKTHPDQTYAQPVLDVQILIKGAPGNDVFAEEYIDENGVKLNFAKAAWRIKGVAYSGAGIDIITAGSSSLRKGFYLRGWKLTSKRIKVGKNWIWVPVLQLRGAHTEKFLTFVKGLI